MDIALLWASMNDRGAMWSYSYCLVMMRLSRYRSLLKLKRFTSEVNENGFLDNPSLANWQYTNFIFCNIFMFFSLSLIKILWSHLKFCCIFRTLRYLYSSDLSVKKIWTLCVCSTILLRKFSTVMHLSEEGNRKVSMDEHKLPEITVLVISMLNKLLESLEMMHI